ncbi:hypothetical protein BWI96_04165 [Siphonobacter sp. SORGH_AS_0500]|uniref:capsule assembly Wzi family protein n=1 Tax=Siphonobacter sp. SORGH_AS_0500 TaxID=1864824 RepID=UPI000CB89240|nr:capsule assembly Wzi family protein [Siphonobacter sp. SORGH_AS_0500]PKK37673.1 hypothetical protein BWI96_04165 [Siphonobacter sp. SORGH_AS_0500]
MRFFTYLSLGILLGFFNPVFAQDDDESKSSGSYYVQAATTALSTSGRTPFWLQTNQYGTIPIKPQAGLFTIGAKYHVPLSSHTHHWSVDGAFEGLLQTQNPNVKGIITEGYLRLNFKNWELYGGRKREYVGLSDTLTGTGSLNWSGNSLPIPQIHLGTKKFVPVPLVGKWLKFKAYFAHGWFENYNSFTKDAYLHQKGFYLKFGKENWLINLYGGLSHFVQWGGYAPSLKGDPGILSKDGKFNGSWFAYWNGVVLAKSMQVKYGYQGYPFDDFISIDVNRIGNHLGTVDAALEVKHCDFNLFFYRQSMFDDGSLYYLINIDDGLNGVRYINHIQQASDVHLERVGFEYLSTISQGGNDFIIDDPLKRGGDNYFNHSQYQDGWTYFDRSIGTPFVQPDSDLKKDIQTHVRGMPNNRVQVFNLTFLGKYKKRTTWEIRGSYSRNFGTYNNMREEPYVNGPFKQFSGLIRIGVKMPWLRGSEFSGALAYDKGQMYDDTFGAYLSIRKTGLIGRTR